MQADLTEITGADKYCYTGFQFGWMSVVDNIWMFGQNFQAGKKEIKLGDEKSGWAYQTAVVPAPGVSLSGRYSPDMTSMSGSFDLGLLGNGALNINLSEQPEKQLWDLSFGIHGIGRSCFSYRTQSLLYHNFSWACSLWENLFFGTEVQTVPFLPHTPPQSKIKFAGNYSLGPSRHAFWSYATGNLGKTLHEIGLGYVRQFSDIFQLACYYDLSATQDQRWKSLLKLGYLLHLESPLAFFQLRGFIDSTLKLVCLGDQPIGDGISMSYSLKFDFLKNNYDLGIGINLSPISKNIEPESEI